MNTIAILLISIRGSALALSLAGQKRASDALYMLSDAAEAGLNVDAHLALVAAKLKDRTATDEDWIDVIGRIQTDSQRLHGA